MEMRVKFTETAPFVGVEYQYDVEKILYKGKSRFQEIMVFENPNFGRMLILDNVVQITDRDEFFYHEMLSHVLLHAHPNPRKVVVIGGGDGGTVREVCKHPGVEQVYFIEIDPEVIRVSEEFFPKVASANKDPRVEIKCMDGAEFIKSCKGDIDVVLVDSTDPIGFARTLYTDNFFKTIHEAMREDGMFGIQSESLLLHADIIAEVQQSIRKVFPISDLITFQTATYPGNWWTISVGSKKHDPRTLARPVEVGTRYYSDEMHAHSFLPRGFYERVLTGKLGW
jgi:spermidine synthase